MSPDMPCVLPALPPDVLRELDEADRAIRATWAAAWWRWMTEFERRLVFGDDAEADTPIIVEVPKS